MSRSQTERSRATERFEQRLLALTRRQTERTIEQFFRRTERDLGSSTDPVEEDLPPVPDCGPPTTFHLPTPLEPEPVVIEGERGGANRQVTNCKE